jgi:hypothetical protein
VYAVLFILQPSSFGALSVPLLAIEFKTTLLSTKLSLLDSMFMNALVIVA